MDARPFRGPGVVMPPPVLYLIGFLAGLAVHAIAPGDVFPPSMADPLRLLGWGILTAGFALAASALISFRRARTTVAPVREASALVAFGPYRFTRNPMYLSLAVVYVGTALAVDRTWPLLFLLPVILVVHHAVIRREEAYLSRRFGEAYDAYRRRVPRWLGKAAR